MHVEPHETPEQLAERIRTEPRAPVARRLMVVRLAKLGHTASAISVLTAISVRQVYAWVARYNQGGHDALVDRPGRGRKGPLSPADELRLKDRLRAGATSSDGVCTLRGEDVRRILREEFGVVRSLQAIYDLLHRLGFEPLRPRPRHPKADASAQEDLKKVSPNRSPKSPRPTPRNGSRFGSRTRPASVRKGHSRASGPSGVRGRRLPSKPATATSMC